MIVSVGDVSAARRAALAVELRTFLRRYAAGGGDALLEAHRDDGTGHCRVCSTGGQAGRMTWPCQLYCAAQAAVAERLAPHSPAVGRTANR